MPQAPTLFIVGKTYQMRSIGDADCIWRRTIASRTAATVAFTDGTRCRVKVWSGVETCNPLGSYSMAPTLYADKVAPVAGCG